MRDTSAGCMMRTQWRSSKGCSASMSPQGCFDTALMRAHSVCSIGPMIQKVRRAARGEPQPLPLAAQMLLAAKHTPRAMLARRAQSLGRLRKTFPHSGALDTLAREVAQELEVFCVEMDLDSIFGERVRRESAEYLIEELAREAHSHFVLDAGAKRLEEKFLDYLDVTGTRADFDEDLRTLSEDVEASWELVGGWLDAFIDQRREDEAPVAHLRAETIASILVQNRVEREVSSAATQVEIKGLLGQHPRIEDQVMHDPARHLFDPARPLHP